MVEAMINTMRMMKTVVQCWLQDSTKSGDYYWYSVVVHVHLLQACVCMLATVCVTLCADVRMCECVCVHGQLSSSNWNGNTLYCAIQWPFVTIKDQISEVHWHKIPGVYKQWTGLLEWWNSGLESFCFYFHYFVMFNLPYCVST